jgi:succinate-acetate transporter protein
MSQNYFLTDTAFIAWNALMMVLLIIGIALYTYGYMRREATGVRVRVILIGFFLILWGVFTYLIATGFLSGAISRSMNPEMSALTIWDYISYWTWEIKGIFGIGTGVLLITTSLLKRHAQQTQH